MADDSTTVELSKESNGADNKKGILRWDVEVPPQAMGDKAVKVEHQFNVEYDKQMSLTGVASVTK